MKIFITGGTGFIGAPVMRLLKDSGHDILALSSRKLKNEKGLKYIKGDLSKKNWQKEVKNFKPDAVLHLAWQGIPDYGFKNSLLNLKNSLDLFSFIYGIGCGKIVSAGTCWEYGLPSGKVSEETAPNPVKSIGSAKLSITLLGKEIAKEKSSIFISARLFFVYGPGQKSTSLIPSILKALSEGRNPEIKNPKSANDFIYVEDAAKALVSLLTEEAVSGIYNVGSGKLTSVAEVANEIYRELSLKNKIAEPKTGKNSGFYANIAKIGKATEWKPETSIEIGIKKTINLC